MKALRIVLAVGTGLFVGTWTFLPSYLFASVLRDYDGVTAAALIVLGLIAAVLVAVAIGQWMYGQLQRIG